MSNPPAWTQALVGHAHARSGFAIASLVCGLKGGNAKDHVERFTPHRLFDSNMVLFVHLLFDTLRHSNPICTPMEADEFC